MSKYYFYFENLLDRVHIVRWGPVTHVFADVSDSSKTRQKRKVFVHNPEEKKFIKTPNNTESGRFARRSRFLPRYGGSTFTSVHRIRFNKTLSHCFVLPKKFDAFLIIYLQFQ